MRGLHSNWWYMLPTIPTDVNRLILTLGNLPEKKRGRATYAGVAKLLGVSLNRARQIVRLAKKLGYAYVISTGNGAGRGIKSVIYLSNESFSVLDRMGINVRFLYNPSQTVKPEPGRIESKES